MGLRVDRQAALGWLGIEGYRPSGRVHPTVRRSLVETEDREELAEEVAAAAAVEAVEPVEIPAGSSAFGETGPDSPATDNPSASPEPVATPPAPAQDAPGDRLTVTVDSPHRALAEAIARLAGLPCETAEGGDVLRIGGETWELAALAVDGQAKRRLWRALVARTRRPRP